MQIGKTHKLEKVVSKDASRAALQSILVDETDKVAVATNGKSLAVVPVLLEPEENDRFINGVRLLPTKVITEGRKASKSLPNTLIKLEDRAVLFDGREIMTEDDIPFPNWRQVIPRNVDGFKVNLDAKLLYDLAEAINDGKDKSQRVVTLSFKADEPGINAIMVTVPTGGAYGVLMPCRGEAAPMPQVSRAQPSVDDKIEALDW